MTEQHRGSTLFVLLRLQLKRTVPSRTVSSCPHWSLQALGFFRNMWASVLTQMNPVLGGSTLMAPVPPPGSVVVWGSIRKPVGSSSPELGVVAGCVRELVPSQQAPLQPPSDGVIIPGVGRESQELEADSFTHSLVVLTDICHPTQDGCCSWSPGCVLKYHLGRWNFVGGS